MPEELEVVAFATAGELWSWLERYGGRGDEPQGAAHPGVWVRLQRAGSPVPSITFHDLLEAGIAFGWSESTRRAGDATSYLQRFTPRRTRGTASERNRRIASRLEREGRMTPAGRRALSLPELPGLPERASEPGSHPAPSAMSVVESRLER
jgi:uncharacterized protein YdeI (YjbR/CyaY-like superfamily)